MKIYFTNNETKETLIKKYVGGSNFIICGYNATPQNEVKKFQALYDKIFGKDKYTFFLGE